MNAKTRLDDRLNGLLVVAVVVLSIGLDISVFAQSMVEASHSARAAAAAARVVTPSSQVTALSMAVQMPR